MKAFDRTYFTMKSNDLFIKDSIPHIRQIKKRHNTQMIIETLSKTVKRRKNATVNRAHTVNDDL